MSNVLAYFPLIAPALLCLVAVVAGIEPGSRPHRVLRASRAATLASLALASATGVLVAIDGPFVSRVLGVGEIGLSVRVDALSSVMFGLVGFIGVIVIHFSRNYLDGDPRHGAFLGGLCLTLAAVFMLVLSGNLFQLVAAWIGTSLALQRLLLFYRDRPRAVIAARKKFIVARIGDACLVGAAVLLAQAFDTSDIGAILEKARSMGGTGKIPLSVRISAVLIAVAALLNSAQFPIQGWLPEVMETPTPVSALLHAGIINAGGFLVVRLADVVLLSPSSLHLLALVGGFTAVFGSVVMLTQTSIKASLAYSTIAQMGFMLFECGLGAFAIAVLHIVAHSLYKAHAFLASGSAVEVAPTRAPTAPRGQSAIRILASLAGALAVFATIHALVGGSGHGEPVRIVLGAILVMGLTHLFALVIDGSAPSPYVLGRTVVAAAATTLAYFLLKSGAEKMLASTVPVVPEPDVLTIGIMALVVGSLGLVAVLQLTAVAGADSPKMRAAYVHLKNGLYVNVCRLFGWQHVPPAAVSTAHQGDRSMKVNTTLLKRRDTIAVGGSNALSRDAITAAVLRATRRIAPLWPLEHFVAVSPFLGLADLDLADAAITMARVAGARTTMPRRFYAEAIERGRIDDRDLAEALEEATPLAALPRSVAALKAAACSADPSYPCLSTVADVAATCMGHDWPRLVTERISDWAAAYFDHGQASWRSPWRELSPFAAWRAEASVDRTSELMGIVGFRSFVKRLPGSAADLTALAVKRLGIPASGLEAYLHRLLMTIGGWAGYARYRVWQSELHGREDTTLAELLTVRLAWDLALLETFAEDGLAEAWANAHEEYAHVDNVPPRKDELAVDVVLQTAYEKAWQRELFAKFSSPRVNKPARRPLVQAVFCIDVRSEVFRRALETVDPHSETIGFAGFFGFPIEYVPIGHVRGSAQCPVLLTPKFVVCETVKSGAERDERKILALRLVRRRVAKGWKSFKLAAVSSFGFVETMGLGFAAKLVSDSFGVTRAVMAPSNDGLDRRMRKRLGPGVGSKVVNGRPVGLRSDERLAMAEQVLKTMSLTEGFARLVLLAGHGSTTVNNPHATALDCGACGGHSGEANARVATAVLNDSTVRIGLEKKGIGVPEDTVFLACLHDTTTDEITVFDEDSIPPTHAADLVRLKDRLAAATRVARAERGRLFQLGAGRPVDAVVVARSRDWSQVRPEWGLAGCAAFIAAPRHRTQGLDLAGRCFLHSYDWHRDENFDALELIMTAPMVVASWISLQYYGSTVDNDAFGSGNKLLHNVVSRLGVLEGSGGDLRVGVPWQSVHDGECIMHEPVRLSIFIEAPIEAISAVIAKHESVRQLLDNGWLHLFAIAESGEVGHRYIGGLDWRPVSALEAQLVA